MVQDQAKVGFRGGMRSASIVGACGAILCLAGCGVATQQQSAAGTLPGMLRGVVHGGQQPIVGATIQMYAANGAGDGAPALPLLKQVVKTDGSGEFTVTGLYTCPTASTLTYLVSTGGNPGLGAGVNNAAASTMAALGACGDLSDATYVVLNEETTVGAVWALAPFMSSYAAVNSGTADEPRLALAFAEARHLVDIGSGLAPGPGLPSGFAPPVAEMNTIANVLASCINSRGGVAGDKSACGNLFAAAMPSGGTAAVETVGAALQIAQHASSNVQGIFDLAPSTGPFQPALTSAPADWSVAISPSIFETYIDVQANRAPINPNIYGIANYGLDTTFAAEIAIPNVRWGGDGTTRYNWQVDSSNAGFDWYFMGGDGSASPVPSASVDQMITTYKSAGAGSLITIPIIPYVNKGSPWNCSFPVSVYGAQQSTNPYVHPNGDNCGNGLKPDGTQLSDTDIYANHVDNSTAAAAGVGAASGEYIRQCRQRWRSVLPVGQRACGLGQHASRRRAGRRAVQHHRVSGRAVRKRGEADRSHGGRDGTVGLYAGAVGSARRVRRTACSQASTICSRWLLTIRRMAAGCWTTSTSTTTRSSPTRRRSWQHRARCGTPPTTAAPGSSSTTSTDR